MKTVRENKAILDKLGHYGPTAIVNESRAGEFVESPQMVFDILLLKQERRFKHIPERSALLVAR